LQGESPLGVVEHGLDGGLHVAMALFLILHPAGLQVAVGGGDVVVLGQVLAQIDDLEFVATGEHYGQVAAVAKACFGRQGHPVDAVGQGTGAVGLDGDALARHLLESRHKILVYPQRWLTAREHDKRSPRVLHHLPDNLGQRHHRALLVLRVAEGTTQVASAQPDEYAGGARVVTLALQGLEDLVNLPHRCPRP